MTSYYPGKTLLQESQFLRDKVTELAQKFSGNRSDPYYTLLPKWDGINTGTSPKYAQWDSVQYNGTAYRVCNPAGAEYNETPSDTGGSWYSFGGTWETYTDETSYNAGAKVRYKSDPTLANYYYYIARHDGVTTAPTHQTTTADWWYIQNSRTIKIYVKGQVE